MAAASRRRVRSVARPVEPQWYENPWVIGGGVAALAALVWATRASGSSAPALPGTSRALSPTGGTTPRASSGTGFEAPLPSAPSSITPTPASSTPSTSTPGFYDPYAPLPSSSYSPPPSPNAGGCTATLAYAQSSYTSPGDWFSNGTWSAGSVVTVLEKRVVGATPWFRVRSQAGLEAWIVPQSEQRAPCFV